MNPSDRQLRCEPQLPAVRSTGCASRRRGLRVSSVRLSRSLAAIALAGLLAACGGSGGGDSTSAPPATASSDFELRNAYTTYLSNGFTQKFDVMGTGGACSGTETQVSDKPIRTTFNGQEALAILLSDKLDLQNCPNLVQGPPAVFQYFDTSSSFRALGAAAVPTGSYGVFEQPVTYPATAQAGDKGVLGTQLLFTDSTRSIATGKQVLSYEARADTSAGADSLLILFTLTALNTADVPTGAFQTATYRLAKDGSFQIVSIDVRDANGQQVRLMPVAQ